MITRFSSSNRQLLSAFPADIRTAVDEFYDPSADGGGKHSQITYECLALLCDGAGAGECGGGVVGGGRFVDCAAFLERLSFRLEQDHAEQKRVRSSAIGRARTCKNMQPCSLRWTCSGSWSTAHIVQFDTEVADMISAVDLLHDWIWEGGFPIPQARRCPITSVFTCRHDDSHYAASNLKDVPGKAYKCRSGRGWAEHSFVSFHSLRPEFASA